MKNYWPLITGLVLLGAGIYFRNYHPGYFWPVFIILFGLAFKFFYLIQKIKSAKYRPGIELLFLLMGLVLLLGGFYMANQSGSVFIIRPSLLKFSGISLKVVFVFLRQPIGRHNLRHRNNVKSRAYEFHR